VVMMLLSCAVTLAQSVARAAAASDACAAPSNKLLVHLQ